MPSRCTVSLHRCHNILLTSVLLLAAAASPAPAQQLPAPDVARRAIDSLARHFVASHQAPSVAVAVVRGSDTLALTAVGTADLENAVNASGRAVYRIGSVTKQFTAAIVMRLRDQGKLALDDSIGRYVSGLPAAWQPVTIRQLLNHTSGIPDYTALGAAWQRRWGEDMPPDTVLALTFDEPMMFAPGTNWRYDNSGYVLLGVLIESITGHPWADAIAELIAPLGLTDTHVCLNAPLIARRVRGYEVSTTGVGWVNTPYLSMTQPYAAGAMCSSAGDMIKWNAALHGGAVVGAASYHDMITPSGAAQSAGYGFGLMATTIAGHPAISHGGGIPGFASANAWLPDVALSVTVLSNSGSAAASDLLEALARAALGVPPPAPAEAQPLDAATRDLVVGDYALILPTGARTFSVRAASAGVTGQLAGQGANPMVYLGNYQFGMTFDPTLRISFTVIDGRVTAMTLRQRGQEFHGDRMP